MPKLTELKQCGFERVGKWVESDKYKDAAFQLEKLQDKRATYAFVVGQDVKYIGSYRKHSKTTLESRMVYYRTTKIGGTSTKNRERIIISLNAGKPVSIYALYPSPAKRTLREIERDLIKRLCPEWNERLKSN